MGFSWQVWHLAMSDLTTGGPLEKSMKGQLGSSYPWLCVDLGQRRQLEKLGKNPVKTAVFRAFRAEWYSRPLIGWKAL